MRLNTLNPARGSKHAGKRVGRGAPPARARPAGRGIKGQHARAGGFHKVGFEGGQMPLAAAPAEDRLHVAPGRADARRCASHELGAFRRGDGRPRSAQGRAYRAASSTERAKVIAVGQARASRSSSIGVGA